ncbi:hypothetical protein [Petrachloros mirabilis]
MTTGDAIEVALLEQISLHTPLTLEQLHYLCPSRSWNQLFAAIDHLSRNGEISLRRIDRSTYTVTLINDNGRIPANRS